MLIRFRVENHGSLHGEQELSLIAAPLADDSRAVVRSEPHRFGLLRVIGIYGANASGKSTVLEAVKYMQGAVVSSHREWDPEGGVPRNPFLLDPLAVSRPSVFEAEMLLDGTRYRYGFVVDSERVLEEWLFAYPQGRKQRWFVRDANQSEEFSFSRALAGENRAIRALTRPNSLFLSAAAQNNHQMLAPIYRWFRNALEFIDSESREFQWRRTAESFRKPEYQAAILELIRGADLGIAGIEVVDEEMPDDVKSFLQKMFDDNPEVLDRVVTNSRLSSVLLRHRGSAGAGDVPIPFTSESGGTQALFGLAGPIAEALARGTVLFVDELDASLHPLMAVEIVKLFNDPEKNPRNAQLVFNTHDTNVLESGELRRDQVWFTEKDAEGATHLYPLTDYKARRSENLKRGYLQGRYGAVPYIRTPRTLIAGVRSVNG